MKKLLLLIPIIALNLALTVPAAIAQDPYGTKATAGAAGLPTNLSLAQRVGQAINLILGAVGLIFLILAVYGGIKILTSRGDTTAITKGKDTLLYAVIGLIVIAGAYALTDFIIGAISQ